MESLRVVSFNIRNGRALDGRHCWWLRRRAVVEVLHGLGPTLVALQEAFRFQIRWLERQLPDHSRHGQGRDTSVSGEHAAVFVAAPVTVERARTLWFSDRPNVAGSVLPGAAAPRIATIVDLRDGPTGTRFQLANVHLDESDPGRRRTSAELLVGWLGSDRPALVVGDLNAPVGATELEPLADAGFTSVLAAHLGGTTHEYTGSTEGPRIDHILARGPWHVVASGIEHSRPGGRLPSDHWPIWADLRLGEDRA